jgi:hypothetical protein
MPALTLSVIALILFFTSATLSDTSLTLLLQPPLFG